MVARVYWTAVLESPFLETCRGVSMYGHVSEIPPVGVTEARPTVARGKGVYPGRSNVAG